MEYEIVIRKLESNPKYQEKSNYYHGMPEEPKYFDRECLRTTLSQEEFIKIRNEIMKRIGD